MKSALLELSYLIGSVTFIVGLKMMGNPKSARKGNLLGAAGMTLAILGTIFLFEKKTEDGAIVAEPCCSRNYLRINFRCDHFRNYRWMVNS